MKDNRTISSSRCSLILVLALAGIVDINAGTAVSDARQLIREMSQASRTLHYDGVFICRRKNRINMMRIIHKAAEDGEYERLISLTGSNEEVISDKEVVRYFFHDSKQIVIKRKQNNKLFSSYLPVLTDSALPMYNFTVSGMDRVAGRDAWVVNIVPKDEYRYGYQFWIDKRSKLLLKVELKNRIGMTLQQITFVRLDILDAIPDSLLNPSVAVEDYARSENKAKKAEGLREGYPDWKVTWVPSGFNLSRDKQYSVDIGVEYIIFSDGLATITVLFERRRAGSDVAIQDSFSWGEVNIFTVQDGNYYITAVGEVPKLTAQLIAASVRK